MKLFDKELELQLIKTLCESPKGLQGYMLSNLHEEHFHSQTGSRSLTRIKNLLRNDNGIPHFDELKTDPVIPESSRKELKGAKKIKIVESQGKVDKLLRNLQMHYKAREAFHCSEEITKHLQEDSFDIDEILEKQHERLSKIRTAGLVTKDLLEFGVDANSDRILDKLLDDTKAEVIPTGFKAFDEDLSNKGFFGGSFILLGATSGGGKSTVANQLGLNIAEAGHDTVLVPLEMTEEEQTGRILANLSGIPVNRILTKDTTKAERKKMKKALHAHRARLQKSKTRLTIFKPETDMSIEEMLMYLEHRNDKVVIIDYLSLARGLDGDNAWQKLGAVARFCKVWAMRTNKVVIGLVQVDDEGKLRLSKAMADHANNFWWWTVDENERTNVLFITQRKARNHNPAPFELGIDWGLMRVGDADATFKEELPLRELENELVETSNKKKNKKVASEKAFKILKDDKIQRKKEKRDKKRLR